MKLSAGAVSRFISKPERKYSAVLLYGPDRGLVRERARILARHVVEDEADPFRVADLTQAALKDDPALLADEAAAMALTGGRRVVRLRDAADWAVVPVTNYFEGTRGDALVIVEAGELASRSKLRKLFEDSPDGIALPCYPDEGEALGGFIETTLRENGLTIDADALNYLTRSLGPDRMLGRMELEKLSLYALGRGRVSLDDVMASVGDSGAVTLDDVAFATADGDARNALGGLNRVFLEGGNPIAVIRSVSRHFQRLDLASNLVSGGGAVETAMKSLKPPVFFKKADAFRRQIGIWPPERTAAALELLTDAERGCKTTGAPAQAICGDALLSLARMAARRRGGRAMPAR